MQARLPNFVRYFFRRPTLVAIVSIWLGYATIASFVIGVDPYDVYPWGQRVSIPKNFAPFEMIRVVRVAARDPQTELVLIGTSPTTIFRQADLAKAYPGYKSPWNVSYHGSAGTDRARTIDQFVQYSSAKRYLITLDYFYAKPSSEVRDSYPDFQYDETPLNDLRMVNSVAIKAAFRALRSGSPFPDAVRTENQENGFREGEKRRYQTSEKMRRLAGWIDQYRPTIATPSSLRCSQMPLLQELLTQTRALTKKGARVDILIPPYSLGLYYEWAGDPLLHRGGGDTLLMDQIAMRRCAVLGLAHTPGAHVYSMDLDFALASDLGNFRDPAHIESQTGLRRFVSMANYPELELTPENIDSYARQVRKAVQNYKLKNSALPFNSRRD